MIQHKIIEDGFIYTNSTDNLKIRQIETGIIYDDVIDVPGTGKKAGKPKFYTYEETDIPLN